MNIQKIDIYDKNDHIITATYGDKIGVVHIVNHTGKKNLFVPYISKDSTQYDVSLADFDKFLETRCFPRTREGVKELLWKKYGLREYSPIGICRKSHGIMYNDLIWLKFNDEKLEYNDVRIR